MATYEDFKKIEIKIGEILSVEKVPETDRLLKLSVNFNEEEPRTIVSGISEYYEDEQELVGKKSTFVTNLEPREIKGIESNGMILAIITEDKDFSLLEPKDSIPAGSKIG